MLHFSTWKITLVLLVVLVGVLFAVPNLVPESERFRTNIEGERVPVGIWNVIPNKSINLGLDLRGGSHLLYEVDLSGVRRNELDAALDRATVVAGDDGCTDPSPRAGLFCPVLTGQVFEDYLSLRVQNPADFDETLRRLRAELPLPDSNMVTAALTGQTRLYTVDAGDPGEIRIRVTEEYLNEVRQRTINQSMEIIRRRVDQLGTTEPIIQRQGSDRILVQAPGEQDPERLKSMVGQTAQMTFHLVASDNPADIQRALDGRPPPGQELLPTDYPTEPYLLVERRLDIADTARGPDGQLVRTLSGDFLNRAWQSFHPQGLNESVVNFTFDTTGAIIFGKLTANHTRERFAVVLDGRIITAPTINTPITGGTGYIEGGFTIESASDLAALLNAGALPAPLTIVEERTVGATLGADSVEAGAFALIVGFISVVVFVLVSYRILGLFANIALVANLILIAGALSGLQATLTLPGIGGIILTIGMAVDANVLIFERIKEEIDLGRSPSNAIQAGYTQAFSAIFDANVTTLIAAGLLFMFGTGPVRGFAVTLAIGVVTSVFTAYMVSRLLVASWFRAARPKTITI
jgi:preprotein translocase subunit SecD